MTSSDVKAILLALELFDLSELMQVCDGMQAIIERKKAEVIRERERIKQAMEDLHR